jgi:hypothetical protein
VIGYPETICGEAASFITPNVLAVARNSVPVPWGTRSEIDVVDLGRGRIVRRTSTRSDVVALVTAR